MIVFCPRDRHLSPSNRSGDQERPSFNAIRDHLMFRAVQFFYSFHDDLRSARTLNPGAHLI
jgi:hypothetical protein